MTGAQPRPSLEDVLDEFAMEADPGRETLERYVGAFPEYAGAIVDLSRELGRPMVAFEGALTERERALVEADYSSVVAPRAATDPFATLTIAELRQAAGTLGVPRQVLTGLRERRVLPASVPDGFLMRLSEAVGAAVDQLRDWIGSMPMAEPARSYKADGKPDARVQVTLDRILSDAGVSPDRRAELLSDID